MREDGRAGKCRGGGHLLFVAQGGPIVPQLACCELPVVHLDVVDAAAEGVKQAVRAGPDVHGRTEKTRERRNGGCGNVFAEANVLMKRYEKESV